MSLVPRNTSNLLTPFPQDFWDNFFSNFDHFPTYFPHSILSPRTVPYTELSVETSGDFRGRMECKEIPEAHVIVAELPGVEKDEVNVESYEGGYVSISSSEGLFSWKLRLPSDANVGMLSWSLENGVLTVVVPKMGVGELLGWGSWWGDDQSGRETRNVRQIEITSADDEE